MTGMCYRSPDRYCGLLYPSETLPVEYLSGKPLCMDQYYQILSSCRIPGPKRDTVVNHAIGKTPPTHITIVHNFQVVCISLLFRLLLALITSGAVARKHCVWDLISPICLLSTVLRFGCVQQWWDPAYGRPAVYAAGEDLEFIFADEQGANRHPHITAPQHLGKSLQQPDQGWEKQIRTLLAFFSL